MLLFNIRGIFSSVAPNNHKPLTTQSYSLAMALQNHTMAPRHHITKVSYQGTIAQGSTTTTTANTKGRCRSGWVGGLYRSASPCLRADASPFVPLFFFMLALCLTLHSFPNSGSCREVFARRKHPMRTPSSSLLFFPSLIGIS